MILKLYEGKQKGLNPFQVIEACVEKDLVAFIQDPFASQTIDQFRLERQKYYELELSKTKNITILEHTLSKLWEHSFDLPSYQEKIRETIQRYKR